MGITKRHAVLSMAAILLAACSATSGGSGKGGSGSGGSGSSSGGGSSGFDPTTDPAYTACDQTFQQYGGCSGSSDDSYCIGYAICGHTTGCTQAIVQQYDCIMSTTVGCSNSCDWSNVDACLTSYCQAHASDAMCACWQQNNQNLDLCCPPPGVDGGPTVPVADGGGSSGAPPGQDGSSGVPPGP
jgi:hypothetical protein